MSNNLSLREAVKRALALGFTVTTPRRKGELRFSHPLVRNVNHNSRRKDASRALLVALAKVEKSHANIHR